MRADFHFTRSYCPITSEEEFAPSPVLMGALRPMAAFPYRDQAALLAVSHALRADLTALLKLDQAIFTAPLTATKVVWA